MSTFDASVYEDEARSRWGDTEAYKESARRTSGYSQSDWDAAAAQSAAVMDMFVAAFSAGLPADSSAAMSAAEAHRRQISDWYYECSYEMQTSLADMYLADERFTAHYEKFAVGMAKYVCDAIHANAVARS